MFDNLSYCVALKPISFFVPSEDVDLWYVECLAAAIREVGKWTAPIPIEQDTGIIMDGNHRVRAAALLGLRYLPCVPLEYHDSRVSVTDWRTGMPFSIDSIRRRILSDRLGAIKSEVQHLPRVRCAHAKKKNVSTASA